MCYKYNFMAGLASINIKFSADLKEFSNSMQNANRSMQKMGKQLTDVGKNLSIGLTAPLVAFGALSLKNWDTQAKAIAQVEAGIKSTGNAAGFTSAELQKMASTLQNSTLFGDEEILQKSTAQLLTFTNIAGVQFERTQKAALDLATRLNGDLQSATIQLGKALNDPVANLSALSRSGIQFSEDQKAMINSLVETNRLSEAQTLILDELNKQYGGAAEAAAKAGLGGMKQLANSLGDLTEDFGKIIAEGIAPFVVKVKEMVAGFQALSPETKKTIVIFGALLAAVGPVLVALGLMMTSVIPGLITAFGYLRAALLLAQTGFAKLTAIIAANPFGALAVAIAAVVSYFVFFNRESDKTVKQQQLLTQVNNEAAKSIANEKAKLEELLFIARNENIAKSARLKAIQEINKISPEFLGSLNLETINTDAARIAVEKYNTELLKTAKVKAAQSKLQEIQSKLIDAELANENRSVTIAKEKLAVSKLEGLTVEQKKNLQDIANKSLQVGNTISENELKTLKEQEQQLLKIIVANQTLTKTKKEGNPVTGNKKATALELPKIAGVQNVGTTISAPIISGTTEASTALSSFEERLQNFNQAATGIVQNAATGIAEGFGNMIASLVSGNLSMKDVVGGLFALIGDMVTQLGKAAIAIGTSMLAIKAAFKNPFTAIAAGIALVALGAVISSSVQGTLNGGGSNRGNFAGSFANGGMVPGSSFSGDKLFARVNSGEMILNKRQQNNLLGMMGSGQKVDVVLQPGLKIKDRELIMFLEEGQKKLNRRM